jgi:hypothetical protein
LPVEPEQQRLKVSHHPRVLAADADAHVAAQLAEAKGTTVAFAVVYVALKGLTTMCTAVRGARK